MAVLGGARGPCVRRWVGGPVGDVEELVQDAVRAIHAKRATFEPGLGFTGWVYAIARYKLIDHFRRQGRRVVVPLEDSGVLLAEHSVEDGVVRRDLSRVLSILPLRQRRLIEDVRIGGYSLAEAAARNGCSEGAAKVSVHRSMKALSASVVSHED